MPDEAAVAEVVAEEPVVEAEAADSPVAEPSTQVESPAGEAEAEAPEDTGNLAELLKDMTSEQLDAVLGSLPKEVREQSSAIREERKQAEQRARTQLQEETQGRQATRDGISQIVENAAFAKRMLEETIQDTEWDFKTLERASDPENYDPEAVRKATKAIREKLPADGLRGVVAAVEAGEAAKLGQRQQQEIAGYVKERADLIGTFTEKELESIQEAGRKDGQKGTATSTKLIFDIIVERAETAAEKKGYERGLKDKTAQAALVEKITKVQAMKNGAAPETPAGVADTGDNSKDARMARIAAGEDSADDRRWYGEYEREKAARRS